MFNKFITFTSLSSAGNYNILYVIAHAVYASDFAGGITNQIWTANFMQQSDCIFLSHYISLGQ